MDDETFTTHCDGCRAQLRITANGDKPGLTGFVCNRCAPAPVDERVPMPAFDAGLRVTPPPALDAPGIIRVHIAACKARLLALADAAQRIHDEHDTVDTCPVADRLREAAALL